MIISCDKDATNSDKDLDWLEYTGYIPFPEKDAIWINKTYSEDIPTYGHTPNSRTLTNQYYFNGDTLINNISYLKIYKKRVVKNYGCNFCSKNYLTIKKKVIKIEIYKNFVTLIKS